MKKISWSPIRTGILVPTIGLLFQSFVAISAQAQTPASAVARPAAIEVEVGQSVPLEVVAFDASGAELTTQFRFAAPRTALRVRNGQLTALEAGSFNVVATAIVAAGSAPFSIEIPVTIKWPAITRLEIAGDVDHLFVGTLASHSVRAYHADGTLRPEAPVRWEVSSEAVASIDRFGTLTATGAGRVTVTATAEAAQATVEYAVREFSGTQIEISGAVDGARTGDVIPFSARVSDASGTALEDVPIEWTLAFTPAADHVASAAGGQVTNGRFVADLPGVYTVSASAGSITDRVRFEVSPRDVVRKLDIVGSGSNSRVRTTDFWIFEAQDGRDYAIAGSKQSDGHAFVWDVTDPSNIIKTDSIQVDARSVNDVKVSPDARYATVTREGASDRKNGVVILDLADPAHPVIAAEVTERLTGGVHNAFPDDDYAYVLSNGDKYVILDMSDIYSPQIVGEYDHPNSRLHDVWVHDGIAYSAEWATGVVAVDVGNGKWGGSVEHPVYISSLPVPSAGTHAVFPYVSESAGKFYVFIGDEIMTREGLAWGGYPRAMGSYAEQYDPETGTGGIPLTTQGYIQVIDFTDPENPEMVARYEVSEYGTHNIWVEDDVLYQAYYEGGLRVVDVSGELMGNLYTQGREMAVFKPADPQGFTANSPMVWSAMPHKGHIFFSDTNSGLWAVKLQPTGRPVS